MHHVTAGLVVVVAVALIFDFFNGFHDAANSIATVVSTRVLTPVLAVLWAAFFNFVAWLVLAAGVLPLLGGTWLALWLTGQRLFRH